MISICLKKRIRLEEGSCVNCPYYKVIRPFAGCVYSKIVRSERAMKWWFTHVKRHPEIIEELDRLPSLVYAGYGIRVFIHPVQGNDKDV